MACRCDVAPAWRPSSGSSWAEPPGKRDIRPATLVEGPFGIEGLRNIFLGANLHRV